MTTRPLLATAVASVIAAAFTLVVMLVPSIHLAYRSPSLHLVIETTGAVIALVAAVLALGRFRQSAESSDLLLAAGLIVLALTNVVFGGLAALTRTDYPGLTVWAPLALRLVGMLAVAAAAFAPRRPLRGNGWITAAVFAPVTALLAAACGAYLLGDALPLGIDPTLSPEASGRPLLEGDPALLVTHALAAAFLAVAAVAFARRPGAADGGLLFWLGPAVALAAFARVNYLLFPSLYSEWVYTGDVLRLGFYALLFVGGVREIDLYSRREAITATLEERRRLARDLHDGLAQELAFIVREASGALPRDQLAAAAARALDESRRAIVALSSSPDQQVDVALREAGDDVAHRVGGSVQWELTAGIALEPLAREALIRIAREAIGNAVTHGGSPRVRVALTRADRLRLVVEDDGSGFDLEAPRAGYGLVSMRERAEAIGASFAIRSTLGRGTTVEVAFP